MKTSIEIDKKKVEEAVKLTGVKTIRELIDRALDLLILDQKRQAMADMLGTNFYDQKLKKVRYGRTG